MNNGKWSDQLKSELVATGYNPDDGVPPKNYLIRQLKKNRTWPDADQWRREDQRRLEDLGAEDPVNQSWVNMLNKFSNVENQEPPKPKKRLPTSGEQLSKAAKIAAKKMVGFEYKSDAEWVYHNLPLDKPDLNTAPTPGAIGLLSQAQDDPKAFYRQYGPKMLLGTDDDDSVAIEEKKTVRERRDLFEAFVADCQKKTKHLEQKLADGEKERGARKSGNGKSPKKTTPLITLLHTR